MTMTVLARALPALAALLLLWGCSGRPPSIALDSTAGIDPSFTPEQTEALLAGVQAWEQATGGRFAPTLRMGECGGCVLRIHPGALPELTAGDTLIRTTDTADTVLDVAQIAGWERKEGRPMLQIVMMHELGHAFGLDHVEGTLMRPVGFDVPVVDSDTLARFDRIYR